MADQTIMGKAFEYACLKTIFEELKLNQEVVIDENSAVLIAKNFYSESESSEVEKMNLAAKAAVKVIVRLEPQLQNPNKNTPLFLSLQQDARGMAGDVRDVLCIRKQNEWEIGLSCKHNHFAVKHSRLSNTIDFGEQWFSKPCSQQYFDEIAPLFAELRQLKKEKALWRDIDKKDERFYMPLLNAFVDELRRLDKKYPNEIPAALITYLLGRNDFYKVIANDANKTTQIQAYNIFGTLNRNSGNIKAETRIPQIKVPNIIFDVRYKPESKNTINITCDRGWAVSLRIHNASSKVEPSLKFDVNLISSPDPLGRIVEPW